MTQKELNEKIKTAAKIRFCDMYEKLEVTESVIFDQLEFLGTTPSQAEEQFEHETNSLAYAYYCATSDINSEYVCMLAFSYPCSQKAKLFLTKMYKEWNVLTK